jgi:hypothetical protein
VSLHVQRLIRVKDTRYREQFRARYAVCAGCSLLLANYRLKCTKSPNEYKFLLLRFFTFAFVSHQPHEANIRSRILREDSICRGDEEQKQYCDSFPHCVEGSRRTERCASAARPRNSINNQRSGASAASACSAVNQLTRYLASINSPPMYTILHSARPPLTRK